MSFDKKRIQGTDGSKQSYRYKKYICQWTNYWDWNFIQPEMNV